MVNKRLDGLEVRGGLLGVDVAQSAKDAAGQSCGRQRGANDKFRAIWARLGIGIVDLPAGISLGAFFVDIVNDADDAIMTTGWLLGPSSQVKSRPRMPVPMARR